MSSQNPIDITALRRQIAGDVLTADSPGYDQARRMFYGGLDPHPPAIVQPLDAADVVAALAFAARSRLDFAVRSGGHSVAGHSTTDDGIVIDVRSLKTLEVDPTSGTAWAGSGLTAAEFCAGVGEHGLALGFGDTGSVGIGGITLGGGVGFMARKHGLTIDSLLAAEIVTATGEVLVADSRNHPDLFWALRGGGGNFGVVTRFRYALQPVDRIVGGMIILPATPETVAGFIAESAEAPEELTTIVNVMSCPPMPFLPEEVVGSTVIMGLVAWCGDLSEGQELIGRFRALAEPIADFIAEIDYAEIYQPEDESYQPLAIALTGFTDVFGDEEIAASLDAIAASDAPMRAVQIRVLGGAVSRVDRDATAYAHRDREMMINVASFYEGDDDLPLRRQWVTDLRESLTHGDPAGYVGFLIDEGEERVRAAYPGPTWDRLREVKAKYDPENLFHNNQNIPPAG